MAHDARVGIHPEKRLAVGIAPAAEQSAEWSRDIQVPFFYVLNSPFWNFAAP